MELRKSPRLRRWVHWTERFGFFHIAVTSIVFIAVCLLVAYPTPPIPVPVFGNVSLGRVLAWVCLIDLVVWLRHSKGVTSRWAVKVWDRFFPPKPESPQ